MVLLLRYHDLLNPYFASVAIWIAWVIVVVGALEGMRIIKIFNYGPNENEDRDKRSRKTEDNR